MDLTKKHPDLHIFYGVPWGIPHILLGLSAFFLGMIVLVGCYALIAGPDADASMTLAVILTGSWMIMILATLAFGPIWCHVHINTLGFRMPLGGCSRNIWFMALILLASLAIASIYATVVSFFGIDMPGLPIDVRALSGGMLIFLFIAISFFAPMAEEIFFRGFLFPALLAKIGFARAALFGSLIFSMAHLDPKIMIPIFLSGILFNWLYYRTNSIWTCVVVHSSHNAVAFVASVLT